MAKGVTAYPLLESGLADGLFDCFLQAALMQMKTDDGSATGILATDRSGKHKALPDLWLKLYCMIHFAFLAFAEGLAVPRY